MKGFKQDQMTLLLLKSMAVNYPILCELHLSLPKLLMVVVERGQLKTVTDLLAEERIPRISLVTKNHELRAIYEDYNSTFIAYPYIPGSDGNRILNHMIEVARIGCINGRIVTAMPVVITEELPMNISLANFFTVYLEGDYGNMEFDDHLVVPKERELSVVFEKIRTIITEVDSLESKALLAAACFLYPNLVGVEMEEEFEKILLWARKLVTMDDEGQDANDFDEIFLRQLYLWQEQNDFHQVYALPNVEMKVLNRLDEVILFDDRHIFMKESLFRKIVEPLLTIVSEPVLKEALKKADVISTDNSRTYTVKVSLCNIAGIYQRERMLRFNREKLNRIGELGFIEFCEECIGGN